jgi:hypothetical protein
VNVVGGRNERIEVARVEYLLFRDLELCVRFVARVVEAAVDGFVLRSSVEADETPREMIVHRRRRAGGNHEREQTERAVVSAI